MPILLVKDFNAEGSLKIDMTFMTNADAPILATTGFENVTTSPLTNNPFTGKSFVETRNKDNIVIANILEDDMLNIYLKDKNIFDENNWVKGEVYEINK